MIEPPPLTDDQKANFKTLKRAWEAKHVALLSSIRKSDGKPVALICAVGTEIKENGELEYSFTPFAVMVDENPFEAYQAPLEHKEE